MGTENGPSRAQEVFKKLPGGHSFVLTEYEPASSHGVPIHDNFYRFGTRKSAHLSLREPGISAQIITLTNAGTDVDDLSHLGAQGLTGRNAVSVQQNQRMCSRSTVSG